MMSADNWTSCPRCKKTRDEERNKAYGNMSEQEYLALIKLTPLVPTFREDYEIGIRKGRFQINYHGRCSRCGLEKRFEIDEGIEGVY